MSSGYKSYPITHASGTCAVVGIISATNAAVLPPDFAFVAKRELEGHAIARIFLRRLGTVFVERFEPGQGEEEMRKVLEAVRGGDSVIIFPEGTFRRYPGLLPFRMGTFAVAVDAKVPVVPLTIRGTRSILRGGEILIRRGVIRRAE